VSRASELRALGVFASSGNNRLVLVPGNHDAALLFPKVAAAALAAMGATSGRARVAIEGYWTSGNGRLYAEHGHQIGKEVNRWEEWPSPFIMSGNLKVLRRPWGEQFVQAYYNTDTRRASRGPGSRPSR